MDEHKVFDEFFSSVEKQVRYSVAVLLKSKFFHQVFGSPASMALGNREEERSEGGAPNSSGDAGEFCPSRSKHIQRQPFSR